MVSEDEEEVKEMLEGLWMEEKEYIIMPMNDI